jgi:hypothetical protein
MTFTLMHNRLSFGQAVRRAKRTGALRYYRCNAHRRLAVLTDGTFHAFRGHTGLSIDNDWNKPREYDGATDAGTNWRAEVKLMARND